MFFYGKVNGYGPQCRPKSIALNQRMGTSDLDTGHTTVFKNKVAYTLLSGYLCLHNFSRGILGCEVKKKKTKPVNAYNLKRLMSGSNHGNLVKRTSKSREQLFRQAVFMHN